MENGYFVSGQFQCFVPVVGADNKLEQIERQAGQRFKRIVCVQTLEADDQQNVKQFRCANGRLRKHGKSPLTIITKSGRIKIERQRMFDPQTGKTVIPSAVVWETSQNRHVTEQAVDAACEISQDVSYRKTARQLAVESGEEHLIAPSTVWKKKQQKGKELQQQQDTLIGNRLFFIHHEGTKGHEGIQKISLAVYKILAFIFTCFGLLRIQEKR